jgi:hypothetical protein
MNSPCSIAAITPAARRGKSGASFPLGGGLEHFVGGARAGERASGHAD